jgi:hypothetical protein
MFGLQRSGICCEQHGGSGLRAAEVRQGPNMAPPGVSRPRTRSLIHWVTQLLPRSTRQRAPLFACRVERANNKAKNWEQKILAALALDSAKRRPKSMFAG